MKRLDGEPLPDLPTDDETAISDYLPPDALFRELYLEIRAEGETILDALWLVSCIWFEGKEE